MMSVFAVFGLLAVLVVVVAIAVKWPARRFVSRRIVDRDARVTAGRDRWDDDGGA